MTAQRRERGDMSSNRVQEEKHLDLGLEWEDLMGNNSVLRKFTRKGRKARDEARDERIFPEYQQRVTIRYTGRLLTPKIVAKSTDNPLENAPANWQRGDLFLPWTQCVTRVGSGDLPAGLELAVRGMHEGSTCFVRCDPRFAYGSPGKSACEAGYVAVEAGAWVEFECTLIELGKLKKEVNEMSNEVRIISMI